MKKIVVVGSYITDLAVFTSLFPKDGETVIGDRVKIGPGGKGSNQATAARRCEANVVMVTKIGKDQMGQLAKDHYKSEGMTCDYVFLDEEHETGTAIIEINTNNAENRIIVCPGANNYITKEEVRKAEKEIESSDALLLQLEASMDSVEEALQLAKKYNKRIILNPAPMRQVDKKIFDGIDYLTPNETEAAFITGIEVTDTNSAREAGKALLTMGAKNVVITLGKKGAFAINEEEEILLPSFKVKAVDTTGAGDAFNSGFAVAIAEGKSLKEAIIFASGVAGLCVTKEGTSPSMPTRKEVMDFLRKEGAL